MRRIKQAHIRFISLVPRGANQLPVIYKSDDNTVEFDTLVKSDMEEGTITSIVYAPEHRDSQGDIASATVIKEMAHEFAKSGEGIDIRHDGKVVPRDKAFVAESFIVQKGDPRFSDMKDYGGNPVDVTGAWAAVLKIEDESLRQEYRDGKWNGVSMGGTASVETEKSDDNLGSQIIKALKGLLGRDEGDFDMKPDELNKALEGQTAAITKGVGEAVTEALTAAGVIKAKPDDKPVNKSDDTKPEAKPEPVFKGDMANEDDRKAHRKALAIWKAETTITDAVERFDAIEKIEQEYAEDTADLDKEAGVEEGDSAEVKTLKRKLAKAQRTTNQPVEKEGDAPASGDYTGLSKSDEQIAKEARESVKEFYGEE